ncbi:iron-containing redox enzyme family protein [Oligoflexus tunisiensis]|uniref:iron-containing redox enzyme family protein n=1 Tax=Oligoflexus tunisiensis TaxID=708132 RepID=UPI00114CC427|nr:iron-containing redox enzyme family protein [Oligoflexus tunisiensis]
MEIYHNLTHHIQNYFRSLKKSNRFYQRIFDGSLTVTELSSFLQNVSFLTAHTPQHLTLARDLASTQGYPVLAAYFAEKLGEEVGHDQWGHDDVKALKERFPQMVAGPGILPEMRAFIASNEAMIRRNPFDYFIYVLYAEYFTVLAGPASLNAIERNSRIPQSMMTIIGKHAELDQHHVAEWAEAAVRVGLTVDHCADYCRVLDGIMERYWQFCTALSQPHEQAA